MDVYRTWERGVYYRKDEKVIHIGNRRYMAREPNRNRDPNIF